MLSPRRALFKSMQSQIDAAPAWGGIQPMGDRCSIQPSSRLFAGPAA
jgi:hypothetical protein